MQEDTVDFVCAGEGEETVVDFFKRLLRNEGVLLHEIPGVCYKQDGKLIQNPEHPLLHDLNDLPQWDDRLLLPQYTGKSEQKTPNNYFMPVEVGRGCPFNCTFCSTSRCWHRTYRLKNAKRIVSDIKYFKEKFGYTSFLLSHDALTANKSLITEMCDEIIKEDLQITWECSTRIDCMTPKLIDKMKESGLRHVHMGLETGSERMQKLTNKNLDLSKTIETVKLLLSKKIITTIFFIYGFPEETEEDFNKTLEMIFDLCDLGAQDIQLIYCTFSPGTVITQKYYDQLVFDPELEMLGLTYFGCKEEIDLLAQHKALYTTFYQMHNKVRDEYVYAKYISLLYQRFPKTARYVRYLYNGNYLAFYKDFEANNMDVIQQGIQTLNEQIKKDPLTLMLKTIQHISDPMAAKVRDLLSYEAELRRVSGAPNGTVSIQKYKFKYKDLLEKKTLDQFADGQSIIIIQKENDQTIINSNG